MAEPRRIDDNEPITPETVNPNVEERRPPIGDAGSRKPLLRDDSARNTESEAVLLPESKRVAYRSSNADVKPIDDDITATENEINAAAKPTASGIANVQEQPVSLFDDAAVKDYRDRWSGIQTGFVDEPRHAVEDADKLVKSVLNELSEQFTQQRQSLANQWERGDRVSTEDLRIMLQRYRSFFDRLLNV